MENPQSPQSKKSPQSPKSPRYIDILKKPPTPQRILGPISYSTKITKLNGIPTNYYTYTCAIPYYSVDLSYELKCILRKYLTFHISNYNYSKFGNTTYHISAIANILIIYSSNINHILEILKSVKYILKCNKFIAKNVPKKYMRVLNSRKPYNTI
jgi:hypothetical protein